MCPQCVHVSGLSPQCVHVSTVCACVHSVCMCQERAERRLIKGQGSDQHQEHCRELTRLQVDARTHAQDSGISTRTTRTHIYARAHNIHTFAYIRAHTHAPHPHVRIRCTVARSLPCIVSVSSSRILRICARGSLGVRLNVNDIPYSCACAFVGCLPRLPARCGARRCRPRSNPGKGRALPAPPCSPSIPQPVSMMFPLFPFTISMTILASKL
jgi:hypothetical protein